MRDFSVSTLSFPDNLIMEEKKFEKERIRSDLPLLGNATNNLLWFSLQHIGCMTTYSRLGPIMYMNGHP